MSESIIPGGIGTASDSPLIQGRNARVYDKPRESCPYPEGSEERKVWLSAYDAETGGDAEPKRTEFVDAEGRQRF